MSLTPAEETTPQPFMDYRLLGVIMFGLIVLVFGGLIVMEHRPQPVVAPSPAEAGLAAPQAQQTTTREALATKDAIANATTISYATQEAREALVTSTPLPASQSLSLSQLQATMAAEHPPTASADLANVTLTPTPVSTMTPMLNPVPQPTVSQITGGMTATATSYNADFATWVATTAPAPNPGRTRFDPATGQYHIALADPTHFEVLRVYPPQTLQFTNFMLDTDIQRVSGPTNGGSYGVLFRVQPQKPGDKAFTEYVLWMYPDDGHFALNLLDANGPSKNVVPNTTTSTIHTGNAINHVQVRAEGDQITLNFNGTRFGPYPATLSTLGTVGLIVGNPREPAGPAGMEAAFSHFTVAPLPPR